MFQIGLVGYAAATPAGRGLDITWQAGQQTGPATATADPWNAWVFRLSGSGAFDSERSAAERSYEFGLSADRTTDRWKLIVSNRGTRRNKTFLVRGQTVRNLTTSTRLSGLLVKSMNPHWGGAMLAVVSGSSVSNVRRLVSAAPGIEYNLFPYNQFARRALTFRYTVGVDAYSYRELTIFDRLRETVPNHRFVASLAVREPWGWVGASATTTQHLNARGRYRATFFTGAEILLFSGCCPQFVGGVRGRERSDFARERSSNHGGDSAAVAAAADGLQLLPELRLQLHLRLDLQQRREFSIQRSDRVLGTAH